MLTDTELTTLKQSRGSRNRVEQARYLARLTQVELAAATGLTQGYISRLENGRYADVKGETMRTLARYFGCQIEDLFPAPEAIAS